MLFFTTTMKVLLSVLLLCIFCNIYSINAWQLFPPGSWWLEMVNGSSYPLDAQSSDIINWLNSTHKKQDGGWGPQSGGFQVDYSFVILQADETTPMVNVIRDGSYVNPPPYDRYYFIDCDNSTAQIPLPPGPFGGGHQLEGGNDAVCCPYNNIQGDCHALIIDQSKHKMYESYHSSIDAKGLHSQCLVIWDMCTLYPKNLRGDQCTSADAAGFPMTQLIATPDEVASGVVDHAFRFVLPNDYMRSGAYVHPATHAGGPSNDSTYSPIYGMRFRLKSTFSVSRLYNLNGNPRGQQSADVILTALKTYGMFLADGGNVPFFLANDMQGLWSTNWSNLGLDDSHAFYGINFADFDIVSPPDGPDTYIVLTDNCAINGSLVYGTCSPTPAPNPASMPPSTIPWYRSTFLSRLLPNWEKTGR